MTVIALIKFVFKIYAEASVYPGLQVNHFISPFDDKIDVKPND